MGGWERANPDDGEILPAKSDSTAVRNRRMAAGAYVLQYPESECHGPQPK